MQSSKMPVATGARMCARVRVIIAELTSTNRKPRSKAPVGLVMLGALILWRDYRRFLDTVDEYAEQKFVITRLTWWK